MRELSRLRWQQISLPRVLQAHTQQLPPVISRDHRLPPAPLERCAMCSLPDSTATGCTRGGRARLAEVLTVSTRGAAWRRTAGIGLRACERRTGSHSHVHLGIDQPCNQLVVGTRVHQRIGLASSACICVCDAALSTSPAPLIVSSGANGGIARISASTRPLFSSSCRRCSCAALRDSICSRDVDEGRGGDSQLGV